MREDWDIRKQGPAAFRVVLFTLGTLLVMTVAGAFVLGSTHGPSAQFTKLENHKLKVSVFNRLDVPIVVRLLRGSDVLDRQTIPSRSGRILGDAYLIGSEVISAQRADGSELTRKLVSYLDRSGDDFELTVGP